MIKKMMLLIVFAALSFSCSTSGEEQNLDIYVYGIVKDENNVGVGNATIYIQRGKYGNYGPTNYMEYDSVVTSSDGNYSYVIKEFHYNYRVCCGIPPGYAIVEENCTDVDGSIINSKTVPNYIDFQLVKL